MTQKILCISAILLLFQVLVHAQQYTDEIITYDRQTYRGVIVEQKLGEHIRLVLENSSDTITLKMEEIDQVLKKLEARPDLHNNNQKTAPKEAVFNQRFFSPELSFSTGGGDVSYLGLGIFLMARIRDKFQTGLSVQYFGETSPELRRPYQWQKIPVSAEVQYDIQNYFNNRAALFVKTSAGYSFTLNSTYFDEGTSENVKVTDGILFSPGLGFRCNFFNNTGIKAEINYHCIFDRDKTESGDIIRKNKWDSVNLRISLFF